MVSDTKSTAIELNGTSRIVLAEPASIELRDRGAYVRWGKRALDLALGALIFAAALPLLAVVATIVVALDGWPAFYTSRRGGLDGREFAMIKFRTMRRDADTVLERVLDADPALRSEFAERQKLAHDPRVSRLGHFLRTASLDELPQIVNVLRGEMSLVGPRPVPMAEMRERYGALSVHVLSVKPGMTGMWQVNGRSETTYDERVRLDAAYARDLAFALDARVLAQTVPAILLRKGAA